MTVEKAIEILSDVGDINRCCAEDAEALDIAIKALAQQICDNDCEHCDWATCPKMEEETETITVSKGCLKTRTGRFVVYDVEYLKSHIEQEAAIYGNVSAIEKNKEENKMEKELKWTNEDAIKMLKSKMDGSVDTSYEWAETVRLAINALEGKGEGNA